MLRSLVGSEMCIRDRISYYFICTHVYGGQVDESAGANKLDYVQEPLFVSEHQRPELECWYNVTWPTVHGCPVSKSLAPKALLHPALLHWPLILFPGLSTLLWVGMLALVLRTCGVPWRKLWCCADNKVVPVDDGKFDPSEYSRLTGNDDGL
eukprot:TRINITY_DN20273_c0_g1_i6.p1 TRINITY_DN20273_c0_g1~~TRINITY_DN20273_c0_g1_i6.p1  ORF type:complete len:152 (+),score=33.76 TRINITY_DN20273_c0_g1_i6:150-605(+)